MSSTATRRTRARGLCHERPRDFPGAVCGPAPPFDKLETMAQWARASGTSACKLPTDPELFDLEQAAKSQTYCNEIAGELAD